LYTGGFSKNLPHGRGEKRKPDGTLIVSGLWREGVLTQPDPTIDPKLALELETERKRIRAEIDRKKPPEQRIAFCVQSVQSSGTRHPSEQIPYCQNACNDTYEDKMCQEVGGNKWRVQTSSPKTSPPNSKYFYGIGKCDCIGQEYVLNEIKEIPPAPPVIQSDTREAELAKREKALAERERALLEAENKRLREELEAERKKKK
jgi:hypothetical protein